MAKRLSAAERVARLVSEGWSRSAIGKAIGRSVSTVGRILRGESKGVEALPALRDFGKAGKKTKAAIAEGAKALPTKLPPAKKAAPKKEKPAAPVKPKAKPRALSHLEKAEAKLAAMNPGTLVVIYINLPFAGQSITLGAKGGISVERILNHPGGLKGFCEEQAEKQHYSLKRDEEEIEESGDWTDELESIEFEEYY